MSDQNPYGQPPPANNPYGQPPPANNPYGQPPPQGSSPQPSWGGPSPYPPAPVGGPVEDSRPGTVTAAAWITIVLSGISFAIWAFTATMFVVAGDRVVEEMEAQPEFQDLNVDVDALTGVILAMMVVLAVWSLVSVVLGVLVLRRSPVARILLVISAGVVALLSLLAILSGFSALWLIATIAVIVLLFVGGANDWFARRAPAVRY